MENRFGINDLLLPLLRNEGGRLPIDSVDLRVCVP